jgi:hypothetical protein
VSCGKIVHGDHHATRAVKTSALAGKVRKLIPKIAALLASYSPPSTTRRLCARYSIYRKAV